MPTLRAIFAQLNLAAISLRQTPVFTGSIVATMSLTLATVFAVFALVNTYFFKPLPVKDESRLVTVEQQVTTPSGVHAGFQSYKAIMHWYRDQSSLEQLTPVNPNDFIATNLPGDPKTVVTYSGADYFDLLQAPVILGRTFDRNLKADQAVDEIVISEQYWQRFYDKDPAVLGKTIMTGGKYVYTIIGVIGDDFAPPFMFYRGKTEVWLHFGNDRRFFNDGEMDNPWDNTYGSLKLLGLRKQGLSEKAVFEDFDNSIESIRPEWQEGFEAATDFEPIITAFRTKELGDKGKLSLFLLTGTLALLTIALLNVSNLFISHALAQHKRLALQAVLGAKRSLLFFAIFAQTWLLMLFSVVVAVFITAWAIKLLIFIGEGRLPLIQTISIDTTLVAVAVLSSIVLALLFALISARLVDYKGLREQLQTSGKNGSHQISSGTLKALIAMQMAVASTLIIFAFLALTKTHRTLNVPIGVKTDNSYQVTAFIPKENQSTTELERFDRRKQLQAKLGSLPQVKSVSIGNTPLRQNVSASTLTSKQGKQFPFYPQQWVGADFFEQAGLNIMQGRTFSDEALRGEKLELIVTDALAKQIQADGNVLDILIDGHFEDTQIVGITDNFNHPGNFEKYNGAHLFYPIRAFSYNYQVEIHDGHTFTQEQLLTALRDFDKRFKVWEFISIEEELGHILFMDKVTLYTSYFLAIFTLILACIGIYGVLSYNLNLRRTEFGIRMALGAKRGNLYKLLVKDAISPLLIGVLCAVITVLVLYFTYQEVLNNWLAFELTFAAPALIVTTLLAIIACLRPLQKVVSSYPMRALRNE